MNLQEIAQEVISKNPEQEWIVDNLVILHQAGSRLYGTNTENSDLDIRGITVAPKDYWVGARKFEQFLFKNDKVDITIYDIRKWLNLVYYNNPNVIETIFVPESHQIYKDHYWDYIQSETKKLMSKQAHKAFIGYAYEQYKKLNIKFGNKTGRQDIVKEIGFDSKFASHAFRLCSQGRELLLTGNITLPRPDAEFIKDVRYGRKFNNLEECSIAIKKEMESLDKACEESKLPKTADFNVYNNLLIRIYEDWIN